ncbi:hypothetical protein [Melittangium boletus]|uniref:Uncharacterized protein n=1 Tax=Melittangium boletus DSM 14713 TaxID=1294270 RepID=A0A250IGE2_9BACT|nr:hypothetical protein [Melittangium boletus]ATB30904.1 hypothetical protein MEBOL_004366 [Melittangium boletus DSM 14713]
MRGFPHPIARGLRLVLACLTVLGASIPAHAHPATETAVAAWVQRREPTQRPALESAIHLGRAVPVSPWVPAPAAFTASIREAHTAAPPQRLFLVHRALLH